MDFESVGYMFQGFRPFGDAAAAAPGRVSPPRFPAVSAAPGSPQHEVQPQPGNASSGYAEFEPPPGAHHSTGQGSGGDGGGGSGAGGAVAAAGASHDPRPSPREPNRTLAAAGGLESRPNCRVRTAEENHTLHPGNPAP